MGDAADDLAALTINYVVFAVLSPWLVESGYRPPLAGFLGRLPRRERGG